ncbi:MAG: carboxypeptidase regulatory-like domain-containing protein [Elusimicrobia bacterium]|nr:carboxypeptidase regulatory-like domain-containing protein [Elusimicrobiota bacterium]
MALSPKKLLSLDTRASSPGFTLVEIVIAMSIITIIFVSFSGAMMYMSKAIQNSRGRTLASNLGQERMQVLKQMSYHQIMVTTNTKTRTDVTPNVNYDDGYYPPENLLEGGVLFERLTYVQMAQEVNGELDLLGATPDTGMKAMTISLIWTQGNEKKVRQVRSVVSNPNTVNATAAVQGEVENASTFADIEGAVLVVAENTGWRDSSDANGDYSITLRPGSYNLTVTARGYFTQTIPITVIDGETLTKDISLTPMGTGSVSGNVWITDHLIISHVVASTQPAGYDQAFEMIELYNPTTFSWSVGSSNLEVIYRNKNSGAAAAALSLTYTTDTIRSWCYYLIASTSPITFLNKTMTPDAVYAPAQAANTIVNASDGGVGIRIPGSSAYLDKVAWSNTTGSDPPSDLTEGTAYPIANGLQLGASMFRMSAPGSYSAGTAHAYDTDNNTYNFFVFTPQSWYEVYTSTISHRPRAGSLATNAIVSATDGLSLSTVAVTISASSYASSSFTLTSVATGTWVVYITSGQYSLQIATVTVLSNANTTIPNSTTISTWPASGVNSSILTQTPTDGFVSGWARDINGAAISPAITVSNGFNSVSANTNDGVYSITTATGSYTVTANPNNANANYVSQSSQSVVVNLGKVTSNVNFTLSQGGQLQGFVTRDGLNALPGIAIVALNANDIALDQDITESDGKFFLNDLATGTYTVEPVLGSSEQSTPGSIVSTVTIGSNLHIGTFTITSAFGKITGNMSDDGETIKTGVLVLVTTVTLSGSPPAPPSLSSATLTGAPYYLANSKEDGSYAIDVRGSTTTTYRVYAYYYTMSDNTPVINAQSTSGISVTAGATTSGVNFSW